MVLAEAVTFITVATQGVEASKKLIVAFENLSVGRGSHILKQGFISEGDRVLYHEDCRVSGEWGRANKKIALANSKLKKCKEVTAIVCIDRWDDDTGGNAKVIAGGIGKNYVTIELEASQLLRGFHFEIFVIGN